MRRAAQPSAMPVQAVYMTWAKGDISARTTKTNTRPSLPRVRSSTTCSAKYWMFSTKAKPAATVAA